jgi:hypothetical protein
MKNLLKRYSFNLLGLFLATMVFQISSDAFAARRSRPAPAAPPPQAAPEEAAPAAPATDLAPTKQGAPTTYNFEDDLVTGDLVRPDGELLSVRRRGARASLIRIREHFIPEMLKSIENL